MDGIGPAFARLLEEEGSSTADEERRAFVAILADDADRALAATRLVLAQPSISSQLVDNLNATIHLRALLTDVFLVDEILGILGTDTPAAGSGADPED